MSDPKTVPAEPSDPNPQQATTGDWVVAAGSASPSAAAPTLTQTEASTPGPDQPEQPERRSDADTEHLREASLTDLPEIPGYYVQKEIDRGGMGNVYQAIDLQLAKTVALKVMFPHGRDRTRVAGMFKREVQTLGQIEHPNVIPIYQAGEWRGYPFFTMKLVPGGSLAKHLKRFTGNPRACARLMAKVACAIQALHNNEVVHRDLKPQNILMGEGDEPLVADFGLAKFLDNSSPTPDNQDPLSFTGIPVGTRYYMSPEQTRAEKTELPKLTDIWAIGVMLYEMLAGTRPFHDAPGKDVYECIREDDPPPLPDTVPPELEAIVLKCLAKNPSERFQSASAVANYLEAWLDDKESPQPLPLPRRTPGWVVALGISGLAVLFSIPIWLGFTTPSKSVTDPVNGGSVGAGTTTVSGPDEWQDLLVQRPLTLRWPEHPANNKNLYDVKDRSLLITCDEIGLIALGQTDAANYEFSFAIRQNPWAGNVGAFFGCGEVLLEGVPAQRYQAVVLFRLQGADGNDAFRVDWKVFTHGGLGKRNRTSYLVATSREFPLPSRAQQLRVTVGEKGLSSVTWDKSRLVGLSVAEAPWYPPALMTRTGSYGVFVDEGSGTFSDAKYTYHKEK
jgi:serine/threonine-protein kinase